MNYEEHRKKFTTLWEMNRLRHLRHYVGNRSPHRARLFETGDFPQKTVWIGFEGTPGPHGINIMRAGEDNVVPGFIWRYMATMRDRYYIIMDDDRFFNHWVELSILCNCHHVIIPKRIVKELDRLALEYLLELCVKETGVKDIDKQSFESTLTRHIFIKIAEDQMFDYKVFMPVIGRDRTSYYDFMEDPKYRFPGWDVKESVQKVKTKFNDRYNKKRIEMGGEV